MALHAFNTGKIHGNEVHKLFFAELKQNPHKYFLKAYGTVNQKNALDLEKVKSQSDLRYLNDA